MMPPTVSPVSVSQRMEEPIKTVNQEPTTKKNFKNVKGPSAGLPKKHVPPTIDQGREAIHDFIGGKYDGMEKGAFSLPRSFIPPRSSSSGQKVYVGKSQIEYDNYNFEKIKNNESELSNDALKSPTSSAIIESFPFPPSSESTTTLESFSNDVQGKISTQDNEIVQGARDDKVVNSLGSDLKRKARAKKKSPESKINESNNYGKSIDSASTLTSSAGCPVIKEKEMSNELSKLKNEAMETLKKVEKYFQKTGNNNFIPVSDGFYKYKDGYF